MPPAITPFLVNGTIILKKVLIGLQPRSNAASISVVSTLLNEV